MIILQIDLKYTIFYKFSRIICTYIHNAKKASSQMLKSQYSPAAISEHIIRHMLSAYIFQLSQPIPSRIPEIHNKDA